MTDEIEEFTITLHRTELIPGGGGAMLGFSDDYPGKQFLIIPKDADQRSLKSNVCATSEGVLRKLLMRLVRYSRSV